MKLLLIVCVLFVSCNSRVKNVAFHKNKSKRSVVAVYPYTTVYRTVGTFSTDPAVKKP